MKILALEELRNQFERELMRKDSLESKASYIVGVIAVFLPLLFNFSLEILKRDDFSLKIIFCLYLILNLIVIARILYLSIMTLYITKVKYPIPSSNPNELNQFYFKNEDLMDDLKDNYLFCIEDINSKNNEKGAILSECFIMIGVSTFLTVISFILGLL